jgi:predicted dehydrogenase
VSTFPSRLPVLVDPPAAPPLRWGILGPGTIAADFTAALLAHTGQRVVAAGSRSAHRSAAFASRFGIPTSYGSYDALLADPEVDAVYIATPMSEHFAQAAAAIAAGKHVLVEKSFMRTADEAVRIRDIRRGTAVFVMEAMKTLYVPQMRLLRLLLDDGVLGELDTATAQFGSATTFDANSRLFDPALGGGVVLDIGVYPLAFARSVLGDFDRVDVSGTLASSGVEDSFSAVLTTSTGARATAAASWRSTSALRAEVGGSAARVAIGEPFHNTAPLELISNDGSRLGFFDDRRPGRQGLSYQAEAMAGYIAEGRTESPVHSLDDSIALMRLIDRVRAGAGARFDDER